MNQSENHSFQEFGSKLGEIFRLSPETLAPTLQQVEHSLSLLLKDEREIGNSDKTVSLTKFPRKQARLESAMKTVRDMIDNKYQLLGKI